MQQISDSMSRDVKRLIKKFPSILRMGDVMPTPTHGVENHIHTGSHPSVFAKSHRLDPEKLEIAKEEFNRLKSAAFFAVQNHNGHLLCTWCPKKMDPGDLVAIIAISVWTQSLTSTLCQTCKIVRTVCIVAMFF
jgi:hypothetical protein